MRLVVTRPEPDAARTAEALRRLGHEPILSPMLDIVHQPDATVPDCAFQAVVVTSRNAVRAAFAHPSLRRVAAAPLLAVGDETALEAKRAGFALARSAGGSVDDLARLAASELDPHAGPILYLAGKDQAGDLAARLRQAGFAVETAVIYQSVPRAALTPEAADVLQGSEKAGVLLYSRRSSGAFADAVRAAGLAPLSASITVFCLSGAVAQPVEGVARGTVLVADRPDQLGLFDLVERAVGIPSQTGNA